MVLNVKLAIATALALSSSVAAQQPTNARPRPMVFGVALACTESFCEPGMRGRVRGAGRAASTGAPTYQAYPHIIAVAPGSAAERAGIQPGDVLETIDGLSLLSTQGAERMAQATAGEHVQLGFDRQGRPISFSLELGPPSIVSSGSKRLMGDYMQLQGRISGNVSMEVWSEEPVYMLPDSASGSIDLQLGTKTIIRLKLVKDSVGPGSQRNPTGAKKPDPQRF